MDSTRLKIKIGNHEFEAEGPVDLVKQQFETFKELISSAPQTAQLPQSPTGNNGKDSKILFDKICRVEGRLISLMVKPKTEGEAALVIMLAQRAYRDNDTVTASEISDGLEESGYCFGRLDRVMKPLTDEGSAVQIGAKKGTRYRLTNPGIAKARAIALAEIEGVDVR
jgi:hypothetical protein